ncbi:trans-o-hydroxybenzylidenepyruvate hydratase-aldolase [Pseudaminobacter salicylatoxidans]|uniref:Trans-O-hydroxybenzylidenepyruvate hydratase-aldolase n=1 Tax=Pseudaminobacter salicylatoxidans TaxID=93369 RepID=A0A316CCW4_PSESE|nr:dihydrodipicolinate synthase family protein [Pseudaminobacter salicylatoxidans]PWJ76353.1 trans-o-hydroxybenzylidenepyruvate hydratase-aldolase [Pseudaminobacter salicylatoxidans]
MKKTLLTVDDVTGCWAIMPTPSKPNASDINATDTVDLDETARAAEALVAAGVNGILTQGTLGEAATTTWEEKQAFLRTVVETVGGRVPVFGGTTSLNTRDTIRMTRAVREIGVDGVMLGLPMWCTPDVPTAVQFYRDVASSCPDVAICAYANPEAFKFEFPRAFWAQIAEIPQIVSAKYMSTAALYTDINLTKRRIRLMPLDVDYYAAARIDPEACTAFWTSGAVCGPSPVIQLRDLVADAHRTGDWSKAKALTDRIAFTYRTLFPNGSFREFSVYNIGIEKARMDAAGWMTAGLCRPPYHVVPEQILAGGRESGLQWAKLAAELDGGKPA